MEEETKQEIFDVEPLFREFNEQRESLKAMIIDLEKFKGRIDKLIPENLDQRYVRLFEEKVKAATELFKAILDIRKEIMKSIKDEMEMRRKSFIYGGGEGSEESFDIKTLAKKIEAMNRPIELNNDKEKIENKEERRVVNGE